MLNPPAVTIFAACAPGEIRAAAMQDGALIDYAIERPDTPNAPGDRLRGRVLAHVPGMAGAFIGLPGGAEGFLPDSQGGAGLGAGDAVTVLVTRAALGGKGPRLSARIPQAGVAQAGVVQAGVVQAGPGPPALLHRGPGAIARLLATHPHAEVLVDDPAAAVPGSRFVARAWDEAVEDEVAALSTAHLALPGGVRGTISPTPALVAIDLDASPDTRRPKAAAQRDANRAALPGLARAIRLRNLSGAIVIDLAGMPAKARAALGPGLQQALATDPLHPRFLGFTALGLAEILRPRIHPPLHELLAGPEAAALLALRHLARVETATPHALHAAPDIARALDSLPQARAHLARRTGRPLILRTDPAIPSGRWTLEPLPRADAHP